MHAPDSRRQSRGRRFGRVIVPVVLPLVWLAGVTACSSSKSASTTTTSSATVATASYSVNATAGNAAFCQSYLTAEQKLVTDASNAAAQSTDTAAATNVVAEIQTTYQSLTDSAPADIKPQFNTVNTVIQRARSVQDLSAAALPADAAAARDQVTAWTKTNCGFDPTTVTAN